MCMSVCVCVCVFREMEREREGERSAIGNRLPPQRVLHGEIVQYAGECVCDSLSVCAGAVLHLR